MADPTPHDPSANLALLRDAYDALDRRDLDRCTALLRHDFRINIAGMPEPMQGRAAWRAGVETMQAAVPDLRHSIEDMFTAGDRVSVRLRLSGTHTGPFLGRQGTGGKVDYLSHEIYRIADGRIAEEWICSDTLTLMRQLGAIPETPW